MAYKVVLLAPPGICPEGLPEQLSKTGVELSIHIKAENENEVLSICRDADYIITIIPAFKFTAKVISGLHNCRFLQTISGGYDGIDLKLATELGIGIINLPGFCAEELSEQAMALMLGCSRWIMGLHDRVKMGKPVLPASNEAFEHMIILKGKTLGIIGLGNSGRALVPKANGFSMKILAYDPYISEEVFEKSNVESVSLEKLIEESDYISIHANLTNENRHLIGLQQFKKMKRNAIIVNTSRGAIIDEKALVTALKEGYIAGAGLDVTEIEPVPVDSPLLKFDNVILTGHNAGSSPEVREARIRIPVEELSRVIRGEWPLGLVNPEVKEKYVEKWGEMNEAD